MSDRQLSRVGLGGIPIHNIFTHTHAQRVRAREEEGDTHRDNMHTCMETDMHTRTHNTTQHNTNISLGASEASALKDVAACLDKD